MIGKEWHSIKSGLDSGLWTLDSGLWKKTKIKKIKNKKLKKNIEN